VPVPLHPLLKENEKVVVVNVIVSEVLSGKRNFHVPTYVGVVAVVVVAAGVLEPPELPHAESEIKKRKLNR